MVCFAYVYDWHTPDCFVIGFAGNRGWLKCGFDDGSLGGMHNLFVGKPQQMKRPLPLRVCFLAGI